MKNKYISMTSKKNNYLFDRSKLHEGYTNIGVHIPSGGVVLTNGTLAGYIYDNNTDKLKWRIVGKVNKDDPNFNSIPIYQSGGSNKKLLEDSHNLNKESNEQNISLKSAVKLLREYYRSNFN